MLPSCMRRYQGLLVLVLWQAAPTAVRTADGDLDVRFGYGTSRIDELIRTAGGCNGPPPTTTYRQNRPHSFGLSFDKYASRRLRMGGGLALTSADTASLSGVQATGVVAGEWKSLGFGGGFVLDRSAPVPGIYARVGPLDGPHLRLDVPDVSVPVHTTGVGRAGFAYNQGDNSRVGAFIGVPICYVTCAYGSGGVRADLRFPVTQRFGVYVSGFVAHQRPQPGDPLLKQWGIAVGGHIWGSRPPADRVSRTPGDARR